MRIGYIQQSNNYHASFKAGKTAFYSDFDGTFMPFNHNDVCNDSRNFAQKNDFNSMHSPFIDFFTKFKDKMNFIITTGRSKNEYDYFIKNLEKKELKVLKPETLITRDGTNKYFYNGSAFEQDAARNQIVKDKAGFKYISAIKADLEKALENSNPKISVITAPINKNRNEYGSESLEQVLDTVSSLAKEKYVSFAKPEPVMLEIAVAKQHNFSEVVKTVKDFFKQNQINASVEAEENNKYNYLPVYHGYFKTYEPANIILVKPLIENEKISKLYDVKNEVRKNIENKTDDLVIAAGDGSNDEPMLNPLNYLDLYGIKVDKNKPIEEILSDEKVTNALQEIPFAAIICSKSSSLNHIRKIGQILDSKGIHKVFTNDNPRYNLLNNIKQSMTSYSEQNKSYKYSLGRELYCNLYV